MNVTPEMLLFLAGKMGLPNPKVEPLQSGILAATVGGESFRLTYAPHESDAQFGRLVVWAAMQGLGLEIVWGVVRVDTFVNAMTVGEGISWTMAYRDTPDSIRAAAVVAIARALGWEGE